MKKISFIIVKPTKDCNANCSFCQTPPDKEKHWSIEQFKDFFYTVSSYLADHAVLLWHGGEPMLQGKQFYLEAWNIVKEYNEFHNKNISFSLQTNILLYNESWKDIFKTIFKGSISTSFDPDVKQRLLKGSATKYTEVFNKKLQQLINDGIYPNLIGVFDDSNIHLAYNIYKKNIESKTPLKLKINFCIPLGRSFSENASSELLKPELYTDSLLRIYNDMLKVTNEKDVFLYDIEPLSSMVEAVLDNKDNVACPRTRSCGQNQINVDPNGDIYNCGHFADIDKSLGDFCFGNVFTKKTNNPNKDTKNLPFMDALFQSKPCLDLKRRYVKLPESCMKCPHFKECQGGCASDVVALGKDLYGKYHYCSTWYTLYDRIKESIVNHEADGLLRQHNINIEEAIELVKRKIN